MRILQYIQYHEEDKIMSLSQIIDPDIHALPLSDTGNSALELMEEAGLTQLPVVNNEEYVGMAQENDILDWEHPEQQLSQAQPISYRPVIGMLAHPFEAMRLMNEMNLGVLPVTDSEHKYIGCVSRHTMLRYMAERSGLSNPGGILVLEIAPRDYTLYEIARICENEDTIVLNMQVFTNDQGMLEVTLKLNRTSLDAVVSSFERHNYRVKEVYGEQVHAGDIADKYYQLMNYLNM